MNVLWVQMFLILFSAMVHYGLKKSADESLTLSRWWNDDQFSSKVMWVGILSGAAFAFVESILFYMSSKWGKGDDIRRIFIKMTRNSYVNIFGFILSSYIFGYVLMLFETKSVPVWTQAVGVFMGFMMAFSLIYLKRMLLKG